MSAYDDYSHALDDENLDRNYDDPKDVLADKPRENKGDPIDLRIPASTAELDAREEALITLEKNLMEKRRQLQEREMKLEGSGVVEDNWPCSLYPVTYHSIKADIPLQNQPFVRKHYWILKLTMFALTWNFLTLVIMYVENAASSTNLMWATIYLMAGVPGSWKLWYKAIYRAVGTDRRVKFVQYFFFGGCHTIFSIVACIGVKETALMGFLFMIDAMNVSTGCGICGVLAFGVWAAIALSSVIMLRRTYKLYRSRGGDLQKDSAALRADVAGNVATGRMVLQGVSATG